MTSEKWLAGSDPATMLEFLPGKASDRKLRLFTVACFRRIWKLFKHESSRRAVDVAERYADGLTTEDHCVIAEAAAFADLLAVASTDYATTLAASNAAFPPREKFLDFVKDIAAWTKEAAKSETESCLQADLLRCIVGNPFRPVSVDRIWLTGNVVELAQAIYDQRAFERLPILADALEEAGCTNQDVLEHCRSGGEHVRGCWVVDLVLGKA